MADEIIQSLFSFFGKAKIVEDNIRQEEILEDIRGFTHFAVHGSFVLVRTNKGRCLLEKREVNSKQMMGFLYKTHKSPQSETFWHELSNVDYIGKLLRSSPNKRVTIENLAQ